MAKCSVTWCDRDANTRGLCLAHYRRLNRAERRNYKGQIKTILSKRFNRPMGVNATKQFIRENCKVNRRTGCWEWQKSRTKTKWPYGRATLVGGKGQPAHRLAFRVWRGEFDNSLKVLHRCDNPPCCNPRHLFLGTCLDNTRDMIAKGRMRPNPLRLEEHPLAKLTQANVRFIRASKIPQRQLAARFGVTKTAIANARTGKTWKFD